MQIILGCCADDPRKLRKTITNTRTVSAQIKDDIDILSPDFWLVHDDAIISGLYNYVQAWGRQYFISRIDLITGQGMRISCRQDTLSTYADQIAACPATLLRCSAAPDTYLPDAQLPIEAYKLQQVLQFGGFNFANQAIIVCVG